ncbi:MAG: T9SS type A sorting domain-containing protein [Bacteroidetes bacterium]|nr:T9SS type A sorting domain-containing protein [Bacteroidota bacterium]
MKLFSTTLFIVTFSVVTFAQTWQDVGGGTNSSSHGMCLWNGMLVNAGSFNNPCQKVAGWDGTTWSCMGGGVGLVGRDAIEWNGNLVVVGDFWNNFQPCTDCNGIGVWDGTTWSPLGTGFNNDVLCLAIWNGDLVAGGDFTEADGQPCSRVARWDGTTWQPIGGPTDFDNDIRCMVEYDGELWVGGDFSNVAGCTACDGLVRWNGTNWVGGDSGVDIQGGVDSTVRVLYINPNDGNLYMGGHFTDLSIDGVTTAFNGVAMYDGSAWTPLGSGVNSYVRAIHEYNGNLIVGGDFTSASGTAANKIAKWNPGSSSWSAMGSGMNDYVKSAAVYSGVFYAGGAFTTADGLPREYIASWYETPSVPPVATINSSATAVCSGSCISFTDLSTNSPTSWLWSFPGSSTPSSTLQNPGSICYPGAGNYTVTLEACNSAGCNTTTLNITVNAAPTVSFTNQTICSGESVTLTAVPSSTGGNYSWSPGGETTELINVSPASTTSYTVTYSLNGCSSAAFNGSVTVNPTPVLTLNPDETICSGNSVLLTATPSPAGGNFNWAPGGETTSSVTVSPAVTTDYTVSYSLNGCDALDASVLITVNTTPAVSVNSPTICEGTSALLTATPSVAGGNFSWSPGGETTQSISVSPLSSTTYSVIYTLNGCQSSTAVSTVTVAAQPTVSVDDASICSGSAVDLTANPSSAGGSYLWSPGGETTQTITVSPGSSTSYTVTYTIAGCTPVQDNASINVTSTPSVSVNSATICAGESALLTAIPSASGGDFIWSPGGETTAAINVTPASSVTYSVTYTLDGCTSSAASAAVTVLPLPNTLVDQSGFVLSAQQAGAAYQWLDCEAFTPVSGETNQSFYPAYNGSFAVEINLNGCIDTSACTPITGLGSVEVVSTPVFFYPNPAHEIIVVYTNASLIGSFVQLHDQAGRLVFETRLYSTQNTIPVAQLQPGIYFISFAESTEILRMVKQ